MSYPSSPTSSVAETLVEDTKIRQPFDALLVLDVEATCSQGVGFDFPNEIIVRILPLPNQKAAAENSVYVRVRCGACESVGVSSGTASMVRQGRGRPC